MAVALALLALLAGPPTTEGGASVSPPPPRVSPSLRRALGVDTGTLVPHVDGSYTYRDRKNGFAATIHPDGRVTFRSVLPVSSPDLRILGYDLRGQKGESPDEKHNAVSNTLVHRGAGTDSKNDPIVKLGPYGAAPILAGVGFRFGGLADLARAGVRTRAQRDFMTATAPLRERLALAKHRQNEIAALARLGDELKAVWTDPSLTPAERRARLFARWDECDEPSGSESSDDMTRTKAAANARFTIEAFVRRVAPPGSTHAFTTAELTKLNSSRRSVARFDPYAPR
jgi:hypothetical protein